MLSSELIKYLKSGIMNEAVKDTGTAVSDWRKETDLDHKEIKISSRKNSFFYCFSFTHIFIYSDSWVRHTETERMHFKAHGKTNQTTCDWQKLSGKSWIITNVIQYIYSANCQPVIRHSVKQLTEMEIGMVFSAMFVVISVWLTVAVLWSGLARHYF